MTHQDMNDIQPPRFPLWLLERFCPPQLHESIEGDLVQQFYEEASAMGSAMARRRMLWNVLRFFRPGILLRNKITGKIIDTIMVGNYFKVAVRNIRKHKLYSFINAFGLSIGIAFCMLIWLFINDELSFDQFHENKKDIYMVEALAYNAWDPKLKEEERWNHDVWLQVGLAQAILDECPEAMRATRFSGGGGIMTFGNRVFSEDVKYIDKDFFEMFSFRLLKGNASSLFRDKREVVITPEIARKYFGEDDPVGKTVQFNFGEKAENFTVTGVIEAPPANSSLEFRILIPQENRSRYETQMTSWGNFSTPTFVQLHPGASPEGFKQTMAKMADKFVGPTLERWRKEGNVDPTIKLLEYGYVPLTDVHLNKDIHWHNGSDKQYSYVLGGIAVLILLIACINYISLALTTSVARRTEVGIRKVVGAVRKQLLYQFGLESILLAFLSMVVGIGLVVLFLPSFNSFTGKGISLVNVDLVRFGFSGLAIALVVGILSGSYPSFFLSRFAPVAVLKGRFTARMQAGFTKPLVVLQFGMSAFLIISSLIMYRQMEYISKSDLGFNQNAVMVVPTQSSWDNRAESDFTLLKTALEKIPSVQGVAGTSSLFADGWSRYGFKVNDVNHSAFVYVVDPSFIPTMDMKMVHGRNFDEKISSDSTAVIVNEALVRDMGWSDLDDAYLNWKEDSTSRGSRVIGVVKNFHFQSLESEIQPMLLTLDRRHGGHLTGSYVRISPDDMPGTIARVESAFRQVFPDRPFQYSFLDENIARQYKQYEKRMQITAVSTAFAIFISCLGLFGLAGINAVNRTKEIGIRKVMGADIRSIFVLLNKQYVWLSLIAFAIATPFSWYVTEQWLNGFKFRISVGWDLFAISIAAGLVVALLTVSYHAVRAALVNPADTLKYE